MIKQYLAYIKDNPEHYWFKRKLYGWGWTPATREGWFVLLIYVAFIIVLALRLDKTTPDTIVFREFFIPFFIATGILLYITYLKGEKPKWQWGEEARGASARPSEKSSE